MKVLNIMTSNLNYNGIGMSILNYYNHINSSEIQMDYLVPNKVEEELKKKFTRKGNKLFEFEFKGKKMHQRRPIKYCIKLYKLIKKEKYDIIHAHGSSSMLFLQLLTARIAGVKIRIAHSRNTQSNFKLLNILFKPLFKYSYNVAFACGKEAGEFLFGKNQKFTIIPNGKDSKMFEFKQDKRDSYRKKYKLEEKIVLGHIGNFNYQKNHDFLIEVFKKISDNNPNYYLILAGKGELEDKIKEKVKEYNLENKVTFLGQIPVEKVSEWLNAMDIMLFPSRFEGFPNVLIEWQMNGLPCIISDKITKDVKITDLVSFESLNSIDNWVTRITKTKIKNRNDTHDSIIKQVKKSGFDIEENAKLLESKYEELYEKYIKKNQ